MAHGTLIEEFGTIGHFPPIATLPSEKAQTHQMPLAQLVDGVPGSLNLEAGIPAQLIDSARDIDDRWFEGVQTVVITAGASAPEDVVEGCVTYLQERYGATVESRTVREEHVSFPLPRELRVLAS